MPREAVPSVSVTVRVPITLAAALPPPGAKGARTQWVLTAISERIERENGGAPASSEDWR